MGKKREERERERDKLSSSKLATFKIDIIASFSILSLTLST